VARKADIEELKRRHGRRLLRLPGVSGVGIQRGDGEDDYLLVVHVKEDDESTRAAVLKEVSGEPIRIVKSGTFKTF
jgi:hypothetical protein